MKFLYFLAFSINMKPKNEYQVLAKNLTVVIHTCTCHFFKKNNMYISTPILYGETRATSRFDNSCQELSKRDVARVSPYKIGVEMYILFFFEKWQVQVWITTNNFLVSNFSFNLEILHLGIRFWASCRLKKHANKAISCLVLSKGGACAHECNTSLLVEKRYIFQIYRNKKLRHKICSFRPIWLKLAFKKVVTLLIKIRILVKIWNIRETVSILNSNQNGFLALILLPLQYP